MTKKQIVKWLDKESKIRRQRLGEEKINKLCDIVHVWETGMDIEDTVDKFWEGVKSLYAQYDAFVAKCEQKSDYGVNKGHWNSIEYRLRELAIDRETVRAKFAGTLKMAGPAWQAKQAESSKYDFAISECEKNYNNVIRAVEACANAKVAMEYLGGLGFDLTELLELDVKPVTSALAIPVNVAALLLDKKEKTDEKV